MAKKTAQANNFPLIVALVIVALLAVYFVLRAWPNMTKTTSPDLNTLNSELNNTQNPDKIDGELNQMGKDANNLY